MRNQLYLLMALAMTLGGCTESTIIIGTEDGSVDAGGADSSALDAGGATCGNEICGAGETCCGACPGEEPTCDTTCPLRSCPEPVVCGGVMCEDTTALCCPGCGGDADYCSGPGGGCPPVFCPDPVICGETVCGADAVGCCPGCPGDPGMCTSDMGLCPDISCGPTCGAQDVTWVGGCEPANRYHWNGSACIGDIGCTCEGADCGNTFDTASECMAAYGHCDEPASCAPQRAVGEGPCDAELGIRWDGRSCQSISGCGCAGEDCGSLYMNPEACERAHRYCPNCDGDIECGATEYCNGCATGSCDLCLDCVAQCVENPCRGDGSMLTCRAERPECGDNTAVVYEGCWQCVNPTTCEPVRA